ncbi:hypothetical protein, partial [Streptomyces zhihengii]
MESTGSRTVAVTLRRPRSQKRSGGGPAHPQGAEQQRPPAGSPARDGAVPGLDVVGEDVHGAERRHHHG